MKKLYESRRFWGYWFPLIVYCAAIFIQSAFPSPEALPTFAYSDKVMHLLAYAVMGGLFFRAFSKTFPRWGAARTLFLSVLCTTLYGAGDEFHQSFVASRMADVMDLAADFAGGVVGALFFSMLIRFLKKTTPES